MTRLAEQVPDSIGQDSPPSELFVPAAKRANYCLSGTNNGVSPRPSAAKSRRRSH